jgi:hypothetical protein
LPFDFSLALLVGRALARGDFVEGAPFRFHPHVGVPREHGARDVPWDAHDHLVAGARFGRFRDQRVAVIVPGPDDLGCPGGENVRPQPRELALLLHPGGHRTTLVP